MNIAVFCSSSNKVDEKYKSTAYQLGEWLAENGHTLIYGGATGGLMDSVSEGAFSKGGKIIGVIADAIIQMNRQTVLPVQLIKTSSMSQRKNEMRHIADMFIVLPGSYGTMDEMFDVIASGTVGEHKKRLIILNQDGFYNALIKQFDCCKSKRFIPNEEKYAPEIVNNIYQCFELIK